MALAFSPASSHFFALAGFAGAPSLLVKRNIWTRKQMASFAVSLRSLFLCCGIYHWYVRIVGHTLCCKRNFNRDALGDTIGNYLAALISKPSSPVSRNECFTAKCNIDIRASISVLLFSRNPLAIFWRVVSVIVQSFNRVSIRTRPHIFLEIFESLSSWNANSPSLAYGYPAPSVSIVVNSCRSKAPFEHSYVQMIKCFFFPRHNASFENGIVALSYGGV